MEWKSKLEKFINIFELKNDIIGILACGSYITGNPNNHSDLDIHIVLNEKVEYRQRGNKIVDGLLIEYFANTPNQIRKYFKEDYDKCRANSHVQFITGEIVRDDIGIVEELKKEAKKYYDKDFKDLDTSISELEKYALWDKMDDLESLCELDADEFDFVFYNNLNYLLEKYMNLNKMQYGTKIILGQLISEITRQKYLLKEFKNKEIAEAIILCIKSKDKKIKLENYKVITNAVFEQTNGFNIDGFKLKSDKEI